GFVKLIVYDILGNEVKVLRNEEQAAGTYEINFNAGDLSSGIYFYRMLTGKYSDTKKMIILK
ncbi:MAG TPA: T9SS type A sorting domain-containing protein, partial [Ignavibacteriaceae bacterium]|nr:T9SS type A sorting domain-containing protein [Ignavibacteriaceae bacterium]